MTIIYDYAGRILHSDGRPYECPEVDEVFRDAGMRWMSAFLAERNGQPRHYSRKLQRLELIHLTCALRRREREQGALTAE